MKLTDERITVHLRNGGWIIGPDPDTHFFLDSLGQLFTHRRGTFTELLADLSIEELESDEWNFLGNERTLSLWEHSTHRSNH